MILPSVLWSNVQTIGAVLAAMAALAAVEVAIPLHARNRWNRAHLAPNFALTAVIFATNAVFNTVLLLALLRLEAEGFGLLRTAGLAPVTATLAAVVALDLAFYVSHLAMHHIPLFWRFHSVHHSDPAVDVTTTIRQHPGEGVIRYAFLAVAATALGVSAPAFAVYRVFSALNGLLEHANIRIPTRIDTALSLAFSTTSFHRVHHSRLVAESNTNYGNIFSVFDRLFRTFTPALRGADVTCGLDGFDEAAQQTTGALFAMPFVVSRRVPEATGEISRPSVTA